MKQNSVAAGRASPNSRQSRIVVPEREDSLARGLGQAHCRYAHCVNARLRSTGHLWQNRFYSTVMDEAHLLAAMRYVERNPVRAGMVADAAGYRWSSAMAHLTGLDVTGSLDLVLLGHKRTF